MIRVRLHWNPIPMNLLVAVLILGIYHLSNSLPVYWPKPVIQVSPEVRLDSFAWNVLCVRLISERLLGEVPYVQGSHQSLKAL